MYQLHDWMMDLNWMVDLNLMQCRMQAGAGQRVCCAECRQWLDSKSGNAPQHRRLAKGPGSACSRNNSSKEPAQLVLVQRRG